MKFFLWIIEKLKTNQSRTSVKRLLQQKYKLKLFDNQLSLEDVKGELLIISQFTLYASIKKGTKPSWSRAANPNLAKVLYDNFINLIGIESPGLTSSLAIAKYVKSIIC